MNKGNGTMAVVYRPGGVWRVRITCDNGLVVESKVSYATAEEAKTAGNLWCVQNGIRTEPAQ
jgi:hypothetical protein